MSAAAPTLHRELHKTFVHNLDRAKDSYEFAVTDQLRMSGALPSPDSRITMPSLLILIAFSSGGYWGLSAMEVMGCTKDMNRDEMIQFVLDCRHPSGGFSGNVSHDPHLLYTLSAVQVPLSPPLVAHAAKPAPHAPYPCQILVILDALDVIDKEATVNFVASLQQPDGSVAGDEWGEIDTRFTYCALNCLALLGRSAPHQRDQTCASHALQS